jgi:hypothetical protein
VLETGNLVRDGTESIKSIFLSTYVSNFQTLLYFLEPANDLEHNKKKGKKKIILKHLTIFTKIFFPKFSIFVIG